MITPRQHGLDTLRAAAILLVFAYHYQVFVSREPTFGWLSTVGWTGVDLFFVLSGYLIASQLLTGLQRGQTLSLPHFYARRLLRTLPNYWVVLALYFLFPAVMGGKEPPALWRFLTFTQNIGLMPGTAFSHAWSLCIEEQFYLLLPLLLVLGWRSGLSVRWGWMAMGAVVLTAITYRSVLWLQYGLEAGDAVRGYYPNLYYASLARMDEFLPGVAVALLQHRHPAHWQWLMDRGRWVTGFALAGCAALLFKASRDYYIDGYGYGYFMSGFGYSLLAMAFALLIVAAASPQSVLHRLRVPGARSLALWSYSIYLSHKSVGVIAQRQLEALGVARTEWLVVAVVSLGSLVAGWLLYRLVEQPFMRLRSRHVPQQFR